MHDELSRVKEENGRLRNELAKMEERFKLESRERYRLEVTPISELFRSF